MQEVHHTPPTRNDQGRSTPSLRLSHHVLCTSLVFTLMNILTTYGSMFVSILLRPLVKWAEWAVAKWAGSRLAKTPDKVHESGFSCNG